MNRTLAAEVVTKAVNTFGGARLSISQIDMDATIDNLERCNIKVEDDDMNTMLVVLIYIKLKKQQ